MNMALYSLVVEHGGKSYSTQVNAGSADEAVAHYFDSVYPMSSADVFGDSAPALDPSDVIYVNPMEGLVNLWAACAGRDGRNVSVVCVRTAPRQEGEREPPQFEDEATLFSLSTEYLEAAAILHQTPITRINYSFVALYLLGHAAELLLKSFLYKKGDSIAYLRFKTGHDLSRLVKRARSKGLSEALSLRYILRMSSVYTAKRTEYRQSVQTELPPLDLLLEEVQSLQHHVFRHVAEF